VSQFNLLLHNQGFYPPYDGAVAFMSKARNDIIDADDNYVRAFIAKYKDDSRFQTLP